MCLLGHALIFAYLIIGCVIQYLKIGNLRYS